MRRFLNNQNGFIEQDSWVPYCWVNVECPDPDDIRFMLDDLHIPPDFLDSIADIDERSRVERDGSWKLTILRIPLEVNNNLMPYTTVPIGVVTNNEVVLTICYHKTELISDFIEYSRRKGVDVYSETNFILRIIYSSAYWYLRYLKEINRQVAEAQLELEKSVRNEDLMVLQRLQQTLVYFNTSLRGNEVVIGRLRHVYADECDDDLLADVEIELHQADNTVNIYSDILSGMLDSFASIISNNVNEIMKKMTGISIVLMIPTLVASFYGMNVQITYGNHPWVFWVIVGGSLTISFLLYLILRRSHWF